MMAAGVGSGSGSANNIPLLPAVRLPAGLIPGHPNAGDGAEAENVADGAGCSGSNMRVDLSSSKFGFEVPADARLPVSQNVHDHALELGSSESDSEVQSEDPDGDPRLIDSGEHGEGSQFSTPTNRLNLDTDPLDVSATFPIQPRLSRAFSMPVSSQLGHLKNPRRIASSSSSLPEDPEPDPATVALSSEVSHLHEISLELADSLQMVIQTLLQLSPPQVLDPAKEQFSACSVSIPTPSISSIFTSVKNLNYMAANMSAFGSQGLLVPNGTVGSAVASVLNISETDFDIGELLQSVGDAVSGVAAEVGVDIVLYHADVGMKHIAVKGDECGVSYALTHIVRQIISVAQRGDSIEIGLFVTPFAVGSSGNSSPLLDELGNPQASSASEKLNIRFDVAHKFAPTSDLVSSSPTSSRSPSPNDPSNTRSRPDLNTVVLRSLIRHLNAGLRTDQQPQLFKVGRACDFSLVLERGSPSAVNPSLVVDGEGSNSSSSNAIKIANEPTLEELTAFADTLKGKKVTLHASSKGSFAHHLSSYLTAWGLDVSHAGEGIPETTEVSPTTATHRTMAPPIGLGMEGVPPPGVMDAVPAVKSPVGSSDGSSPGAHPQMSFVFIDDNVNVLRERLRKLRAEQQYGNLHISRNRPSLNHRPRSSPQVVRALGIANSGYSAGVHASTVIVHFTSLANFKLVKDVIQSTFSPSASVSPNSRIPEVIVIPKPAGPRRFLTALHTAVTKPVVDPFFAPIATSPMSPGLHVQAQYFPFPYGQPTPGSPHHRAVPASASRTSSDRSARSPKELPVENNAPTLPLPSPLSMSDGMEYFADAAARLGTSPSTGVVIQSPDGQPAGIFFHPNSRAGRGARGLGPQTGGLVLDPTRASDRTRAGRRRTSDPYAGPYVGTPNPQQNLLKRPSAIVEEVLGPEPTPLATQLLGLGSRRSRPKAKASPGSEEPSPVTASPVVTSPILPEPLARPKEPSRKSSTVSSAGTPGPGGPGTMATPPLSPHPDGAGTPGTARARRRAAKASIPTPPIPVLPPGKKGKGASDTNIVPPISVLVVDDNPINQTILSTFMRKKKIKYDVAKNGEEAVQKWRTGNFHLILMDIQMPVMDGIQATKEIRRMEKMYGQIVPGTPISDLGQATPSDVPSSDSKNPTTPYRSSVIIVALTASSLQTDRVAALAAGCNDFLTKPVSLEWLNNKIIEWGSIKALQMWADLRPEVVKSIASGQVAQAQHVARKLHVPEGRGTPSGLRSRDSSLSKAAPSTRPSASPSQDAEASTTSNVANKTEAQPPASAEPSLDRPNIPPPLPEAALPAASDSSTPQGPDVVVTVPTPGVIGTALDESVKKAELPLPALHPLPGDAEAVAARQAADGSQPVAEDVPQPVVDASQPAPPADDAAEVELEVLPKDIRVEHPPPMPGAEPLDLTDTQSLKDVNTD